MVENGSAKYNDRSSGSRTHYRLSITKLLLLGVVSHVVYLRSVFDCYFTSPVVKGMKNYGATPERAKPPAKRLVLIVGVF
jgi:phosphatidylinositol glycan class N